MASTQQPMFDGLATGWRWWTRELSSLLPQGASAAKAPSGLVLALDDGIVRLIDERRGRGRDQPVLTGGEAWDALTALAATRSPDPLNLRVPYAACFERRVELPEAARGEAHRFLELELERTTPFRLKDVYTAHYVDDAQSSSGTVGVCQLILKRDTVDPALKEIRALGLEVSSVDCWSRDGKSVLPVDFLPRNPVEQRASGTRLPAWLAVLAIALAGTAMYTASSRYESALASLKRETEAARAKAQDLRQALDTSEARRREADAIEKIKAARPPAVVVLDTLTRLMPDTTWISDIRIEGDQIEFSGEAEAAAPLVSTMENSDLFSDAAFTAPVTREERGGRERFSLRATIGKTPVPRTDAPATPSSAGGGEP